MFRTLGERSKLGSNRQSRPGTPRKSVILGLDVPLLLVMITFLVFGLLMVYSASYDFSYLQFGSGTQVFSRQLLWAILSSMVAVFLFFFDYHKWRKVAVLAIVGTIGALVAVLLVGNRVNNAVRNLMGGSIQPSELAKLVIIIYLSVWLYSKRDRLNEIGFGLFPLGGILGIIGGLIFIQPDLSAVITIFFLGGVMFFLAGGEWRQILLLSVLALLFGWLVVQVNVTGSKRVEEYLIGLKDPTQGSYHVARSMEAFAKGGLIGVGIGNSETKVTNIPFPHTDSIFAIIGEETGLLGSILVIGLYLVLLWRGLRIAQRAPDFLGTLLAAGLSIWISIEAFINISVMVNVLPFAGNALPFISAGGSSLMVSMAAVGILQNISRLSIQNKQEEGRSFSAVVDLRRRDRRRRVSRPGGLESPDFRG